MFTAIASARIKVARWSRQDPGLLAETKGRRAVVTAVTVADLEMSALAVVHNIVHFPGICISASTGKSKKEEGVP
jgi:hypothetical protein